MKVSVYCLVYNHEKYIKDALEGFVNQKTNFDYEVIVHDDASTDSSASIIKEYEEKYPNIIKGIYQTENQYTKGTGIVKNIVLPILTGEYIAICEGDDYWCDNNKLQKQVDFLDANPDYSACVHNTLCKNIFEKKEFMMYEKNDRDICLEQVAIDGGKAFHTSSIMYRSQYKEQPEFFKEAKKYSDYPLAIYLTLMGKVKYFGDIMSVYRCGTQFSFSKSINTDPSMSVEVAKSRINVLKAVDLYTNGKYKKIIDTAIIASEYDKYEKLGQFDKLKKEPYLSIYKNKNLKYKIKFIAKKHFPNTFKYLRKKKYS